MSILDMSDALSCFLQNITFTEKRKYTVNFEDFEECTNTTIPAVVQPGQKEAVNTSNVDWSKEIIWIHSPKQLKINSFLTWRGKQFRIVELGNYVDYGYYEAFGEEVKGDEC